MAKAKSSAVSAVRRAANELRHLSLESSDGLLLGSEETLMTYLSVSRPTLRQAGALVSQERLIAIKRGVNGGYFASRPSSATVSHIAALYLEAHRASPQELIQAIAPIRGQLALLAARQPDREARQGLAAVLATDVPAEQNANYWSFVQEERAFGKLLSRLSGNKVLELLLDIVYDLAGRLSNEADVYLNHPERIAQYREQRATMISAIAAGDEEFAAIATSRCSAIVAQWMKEDMDGR